jgi:diaminopimelate decarboxylase
MSHDEETGSLDRRDGWLHWGGCSLGDLASRYGTPLYVADAGRLAHAVEAIRRPFEEEGLDTRLFFSVKTNPVPAVLRRITNLGCGAEVISPFEYWLASRLGLGGNQVVVNGTSKSSELLRQAVLDDAALLNVESTEELRLIQAIAAQEGRRARIGFRINPCLRTSPLDFTLATGTRGSHAGFRREEREWSEAIELARADPRLDVQGLHFHIGSGVRSPRPYFAATRAALKMWDDLLDAGLRPTVLDMGGGFAAAAVKEFNLLEAVRFFGWRRPPATPVHARATDLPQRVARGCAAALRAFARERRIPVPTVFLEPGRALVSSSHVLVLKVAAIRPRAGRVPVAVCDAGAMSLSPLLLSERHAVLSVHHPAGGRTACYDIVGNLPTPLDIVALHQVLPALASGSLVAVMDVGAYFTALGNNFGGPRLPIVLIADGDAELVRERETFSQMIMRDLGMPDNGAAPPHR